jgi:hypothetical protein
MTYVHPRLITKSHLAFCPQDGVRKGATPTDAFELMLQEVQGITPSAAAGIAEEYPGFKRLMLGYERAEKREGRAESMLQDCQVGCMSIAISVGTRSDWKGTSVRSKEAGRALRVDVEAPDDRANSSDQTASDGRGKWKDAQDCAFEEGLSRF